MNIEKIISELRNELRTIDEAIVTLQRLLPAGADERPSARSSRVPVEKQA
jgi:hypothetical protein